jgi:hypothetical protein
MLASNLPTALGRVLLPLGLLPVLGALGCLDRPIGVTRPQTTNIFVDTISQESIDRIDLLFMIDNSSSMNDKQEILRRAVPDLVTRLVNPSCVDASGNQFPPPPAGQECELGKVREFKPVTDINIAVVSSSLGDAGAGSTCTGGDTIDLAHTMGSLSRGEDLGANAYGFLEWRPQGDVSELVSRFQDMVGAVGEKGCGWEASLESWYRFLVDPRPYRELARVQCAGGGTTAGCVAPSTDANGSVIVDDELLAQRAAFLRDDSLLAVIMLSDENDCSIQARGQYWVVAEPNPYQPMFRGSSACDADANDPCCYSCPLGPPTGCAADPVCEASSGQMENRLPSAADGQNLRCFAQKRRFGFDFLYPTQRYVNALTRTHLCVDRPDLAADGCAPASLLPNPLFASGSRAPGMVYLGGIVGVPWQAIASDVRANRLPLGADELRFKSYEELTDEDWSSILGVPGVAAPSNPWMIESTQPRPGVDPRNEINGREYATDQGTGTDDDLQYACIFPLAAERDCSDPNAESVCDCSTDGFDRPLCEQAPGVDAPGQVQYWAKAYPGLRQLEVLRDYGKQSSNAIIGSICARNVHNDELPDFGYRPAISALVERLKEKLANRCLPRRLEPARDGTVPCALIEVRFGVSDCSCDAASSRSKPEADIQGEIHSRLLASFSERCGPDDPSCARACQCEVEQIRKSADRLACQNSDDGAGVQGWCYVADTPDQQVGNPALVRNCPATERRLLRFVGDGLAENSLTFVACTGAAIPQ